MFAVRSLTRRLNPLWVVVVGLAALSALAITTGSSEASDDFADDVSATGVVVDEENAEGMDDTLVASLEPGATLTIVFDDNVAYNGSGNDLRFYFIDQGGAATADVELSRDGTSFETAVAIGDDTAVRELDLGALPFVTALRITNTDLTENLDLDAVKALNALLLDTVTVVLVPDEAINDIGEQHEVTATVADGSPKADVELTWQITAGPNADVPSVELTDMNGQSDLTYPGDDGAGVDEIVAFLDFDGDEVQDEGEPAGTATKRWLGVTGTIELIDIDGGDVALGDVLTVQVVDSDLNLTDAPDTVEVRVWSDSTDTTGFALELTETGADSGIFEGSIFLAESTNANLFELGSAVYDTVYAEYDDELTAEGSSASVQDDLLVEGETDAAGYKVTLCHVPGGNPSNQHTISVGAPARLAHLAHGDSYGECGAVTVEYDHPKQDFCEKRDDHPRCKDQGQLDEEALGAGEEVGDDDGKPSGVEALCERRPDHRKCADGSGQNLDALGGDDEEEEEEEEEEEDDD